MIKLFQELLPFSNKRLDKEISKDESYSNPVIIPFALDSTGGENILETVLYIRNNDQSKYYKNIVVSLMKEDATINPEDATGVIIPNQELVNYFNINNSTNIEFDIAYENFVLTENIYLLNRYKNNYVLIEEDDQISCKFSYGYEELSDLDWSYKKSVLLIPYIGNSSMSDMSYIPIRLRIKWKGTPNILTIRDYFIDISFEEEKTLGE